MKNFHQIIIEHFCKLGCYLTYKQASILVDYADPEYEHELLSLMIVHDIIPREHLKSLLKSSIVDKSIHLKLNAKFFWIHFVNVLIIDKNVLNVLKIYKNFFCHRC